MAFSRFSAVVVFLLLESIACGASNPSLTAGFEKSLSSWLKVRGAVPLHSVMQTLVKLEIHEKADVDFLVSEISVIEPKRYAVLRNLTSTKGSVLNSKLVQAFALERKSGRFHCRLDGGQAESKPDDEWLKIATPNLELQLT
eukprot:3081855-Rhodomonas_salina.1